LLNSSPFIYLAIRTFFLSYCRAGYAFIAPDVAFERVLINNNDAILMTHYRVPRGLILMASNTRTPLPFTCDVFYIADTTTC